MEYLHGHQFGDELALLPGLKVALLLGDLLDDLK